MRVLILAALLLAPALFALAFLALLGCVLYHAAAEALEALRA